MKPYILADSPIRRPRLRFLFLLSLLSLFLLYTKTSVFSFSRTSLSQPSVPITLTTLAPFSIPIPPTPLHSLEDPPPTTPLGDRAELAFSHVAPKKWEDYVTQLLGFVHENFPSLERDTRWWLTYGTTSEASLKDDEHTMKIPLNLWQTSTSYTKSLKFGSSQLGSWRVKNEGKLDQHFLNDDGIKKSILSDASPLIQETVHNLSSINIQMSDFWRYFILAKEGGVYSDVDTTCLKPVWMWNWVGGKLEEEFVNEREGRWNKFLKKIGLHSEIPPWGENEDAQESKRSWWKGLFWLKHESVGNGNSERGDDRWVKDDTNGVWHQQNMDPGVGIIVGIEADVGDRHDWYNWYPRPLQFVQWTIAGAPGHPILLDVVRRITTPPTAPFSEDGHKTSSIMERTGPGIWTDAVLTYLGAKYGVRWSDLRGLESNGGVRYGDVLIRGINAFSPEVGAMGSGKAGDRGALVQHAFWGTWKGQVKGTDAE